MDDPETKVILTIFPPGAWVETDAVILDNNLRLVLAVGQNEANPLRLGVAQGVDQHFLHDQERLTALLQRQKQRLLYFIDKLDFRSTADGQLGGKLSQ